MSAALKAGFKVEDIDPIARLGALLKNETDEEIIIKSCEFRTKDYWNIPSGLTTFSMEPRPKLKKPYAVISPQIGSISKIDVNEYLPSIKHGKGGRRGIRINLTTEYIPNDDVGPYILGYSIFLLQPKLILNEGSYDLPKILVSLHGGLFKSIFKSGIKENEIIKFIESLRNILEIIKKGALCDQKLEKGLRKYLSDFEKVYEERSFSK